MLSAHAFPQIFFFRSFDSSKKWRLNDHELDQGQAMYSCRNRFRFPDRSENIRQTSFAGRA